jgi:membrane-associated phospholipid phosphatase
VRDCLIAEKRSRAPHQSVLQKKGRVVIISDPTVSTGGATRGVTRRAVIAAAFGAAALHAVPSVASSAGAAADPWIALRKHTWLIDATIKSRPLVATAPTNAESDELLALQAERTPERMAAIERWGAEPAVFPWTRFALDLVVPSKPPPPRAARGFALLHAAVSDTLAAVTDAREAFPRPAPMSSIPELTAVGSSDESSFPSTHAAVAAAASAVLGYLYPAEADRFAVAAREAAESRLWAGAAYRSDVEAGLAIGREVGRLAVARGEADGSDAKWDGVIPEGEGVWQPTPPRFWPTPLDPLAGTWHPWVLPSGAALRPPPPPAWGSPEWQAQLAAVQEATANRTPEQLAAVEYWAGGPGTVSPAGLWIEIAQGLIARDGLSDRDAAAVLALASVAMADGFICCWDAKFTYWTARPLTADPSLSVPIVTPPFPSYTSGHSTISAAAATVLGALFPDDAAELRAMAEEAKNSRLWAGIHFPNDNETGAAGGKEVGKLVLRRVMG